MIAGKHEPSKGSTGPIKLIPHRETDEEDTPAIKVLAELYELLETYAPSWYTEEHRRRARSVLQGS
jgi:hypothetical protein